MTYILTYTLGPYPNMVNSIAFWTSLSHFRNYTDSFFSFEITNTEIIHLSWFRNGFLWKGPESRTDARALRQAKPGVNAHPAHLNIWCRAVLCAIERNFVIIQLCFPS